MSYLRESWVRPLVLSGDMLRNRGFVLLTIFNFICKISTEQLLHPNGWIPMSHNDIYNQLRRTKTEYPAYITMKPPIDNDNNFVQSQLNTKNDHRDFKESYTSILNEKLVDAVTVAAKIDKGDQTIVNKKENTRKAKKVWNHEVDISIDNILALADVGTKTKVKNEESVTNDNTAAAATGNTYEVTEDIDKSLFTEDNNTTEYVGYQYYLPSDENQNLTSTFYKILTKYNINTDDKLQNYGLSLRRKVQNPTTGVYQVPLPYRYNSLNHLPVDPLLAVFLSNYGFYLPSLYGIKANYNNLYGYLASNNIHNNKPFGLYKVFSDTDSWN